MREKYLGMEDAYSKIKTKHLLALIKWEFEIQIIATTLPFVDHITGHQSTDDSLHESSPNTILGNLLCKCLWVEQRSFRNLKVHQQDCCLSWSLE